MLFQYSKKIEEKVHGGGGIGERESLGGGRGVVVGRPGDFVVVKKKKKSTGGLDWLVEHQVKDEMLNSQIWPCYSSPFKISCFSACPLLMLRVHPGETKEREKMVKTLQYSNLSTDAQSKWLNTGA